MIRQSIQWTPEAFTIADEVLALGLPSFETLAKIAERFGVPYLSDNQLRNAYSRRGKRISYGRQVPTSEPAPSTQRSERVPSLLPPQPAQPVTPPGQWRSAADEVPCRQFVAPPSMGPGGPRRRGFRKALLMSDLHIPHMSQVALDCARQVVAEEKPDTLIIDGDFLDAAALSSYAKNPRGTPTMEAEFAAGNEHLDEFDSWGFAHKYHIGGNHLAGRWLRYMWERAPALTGLVDFEELLRFKERGWKCVDYKDHLFFGSALITHELGRGGATAMTRTRDDIHTDCVIGHIHRAGIHWRGDVMGRTFFGASFGWMGDLAAVDYAHRASVATTHVLGFGLLTLDEETGQTFAEAVPVINGRCVAHGKLYVSRVPVPKMEKKVA